MTVPDNGRLPLVRNANGGKLIAVKPDSANTIRVTSTTDSQFPAHHVQPNPDEENAGKLLLRTLNKVSLMIKQNGT